MISDELVQADLIAKLKTISSVTSLLPEGTAGIKEYQWQGDTFQYPAVRFDLEVNDYEFDEQKMCNLWRVEFSIYIFSQERSSKQCSMIKGLLENYLTGLGFTGTNAKYSQMRLERGGNVPSVRQDERTWRSQLRYSTRLTNP